jgi:hypothetical protein
MPKRAASRTPEPICDICHQVTRKHSCRKSDRKWWGDNTGFVNGPPLDKGYITEVNGRTRHYQCWPAYCKLYREWYYQKNDIPYWPWVIHEEFKHMVRNLEAVEHLMKAVNCTSKAVRVELLRSNNPGLALANKK